MIPIPGGSFPVSLYLNDTSNRRRAAEARAPRIVSMEFTKPIKPVRFLFRFKGERGYSYRVRQSFDLREDRWLDLEQFTMGGEGFITVPLRVPRGIPRAFFQVEELPPPGEKPIGDQ